MCLPELPILDRMKPCTLTNIYLHFGVIKPLKNVSKYLPTAYSLFQLCCENFQFPQHAKEKFKYTIEKYSIVPVRRSSGSLLKILKPEKDINNIHKYKFYSKGNTALSH